MIQIIFFYARIGYALRLTSVEISAFEKKKTRERFAAKKRKFSRGQQFFSKYYRLTDSGKRPLSDVAEECESAMQIFPVG